MTIYEIPHCINPRCNEVVAYTGMMCDSCTGKYERFKYITGLSPWPEDPSVSHHLVYKDGRWKMKDGTPPPFKSLVNAIERHSVVKWISQRENLLIVKKLNPGGWMRKAQEMQRRNVRPPGRKK